MTADVAEAERKERAETGALSEEQNRQAEAAALKAEYDRSRGCKEACPRLKESKLIKEFAAALQGTLTVAETFRRKAGA
jgi:hypothetical protein